MLDRDTVARIVEENPCVDASTIDRSREITRRLAEIGFEPGSYRLEPALGGEILKKAQADGRVRHQER